MDGGHGRGPGIRQAHFCALRPRSFQVGRSFAGARSTFGMDRHQQGGRNAGSGMSNGGKSLMIGGDASEQMGAGHIMRCLALSKAWQDSGGRVTFASAAMMPALEQRLQNEGCEVVRLGTDVSSEQDMQCSAAVARERAADWVVVDGYGFGPPYHKALRQ